MKFLELVKKKARENPKRIVFPEVFESRIQEAVEIIKKESTAIPVLPGKFSDLSRKKQDEYAAELVRLRKHRGMTEAQALKDLENYNNFGVMMVQMGDADAMISGTRGTTAETIRPALKIIKTKEKFHKVSGFFFMLLENRILLFADCAVNIEPNSHELAQIAMDTAETARRFGITPKIAMLSFSTAGSAKHPTVDVVKEATAMVKHFKPDLAVDGEMQVDTALVPDIQQRKYPDSIIKGDANILIFPNLAAANIAYKLVERLAHAKAIGPILQGLRKPVNDLSRGCDVADIVNLAAITTLECLEAPFPIPKTLKSIK